MYAIIWFYYISTNTDYTAIIGLLRWHSGKESTCQCRRCKRCEFNPWVRKIPWRRKWQPIPVFLSGKSHGQRSLAGYNPCGHKESDMTRHNHHHHHHHPGISEGARKNMVIIILLMEMRTGTNDLAGKVAVCLKIITNLKTLQTTISTFRTLSQRNN